MSYYRPSFSQTIAMTRGRGGYSPRGSPYRGSSTRGSRGSYAPRGFASFSHMDSRSRYSSSERYSGHSRGRPEEYRKPYRLESYSSRERSPERKRSRVEAFSSRHENSSYGSPGGYGSRYESSYSDRRSFPSDRPPAPFSRRDEFRRPSGPPISSRGGYRGRVSSRGSRLLKMRERPPPRRRLLESSYAIRKRIISSRSSDFSRRLKISKMRSAIAARRGKKSDDEDSDDNKDEKEDSDKDEDDEDEEITEVGKASPTKEKEETDKQEEKSASGDEKPKKTFIKLNCPHCGHKSVTFRKYELHVQGRTHMLSMKRVALKQKAILAQMRQAQRSAQNELEKKSEDLQKNTNFCPLCKLNYKQRKAIHQSSDAHKNMKKFLMPYCKVCSITFKSPMMYENHCCSIEHLKRKQRMENGNSDESADDDNLENFTTIDSVGDVDDGEEVEKKEKEENPKEAINVGIEKIRKVETHYCDLCKMYLQRGDDGDVPKILARHCKMRVHMQRYIRYKEDKDLELKAEKLQRKEIAEKEEKGKKVKDEDEDVSNIKEEADISLDKADISENKEVEEEEHNNKSIDDEENREDKLWADVDKDLGAILAEAEDDDEEDSNVKVKERYDRFKYSEKNGEDKITKDDAETSETVSNGPVEETKEDS